MTKGRSEMRQGGRAGSSRAYWLCQLLGWGGYGLAYWLAVLVPFRAAGWRQLVADTAYCAAGLAGTHLLRQRIRRGAWSDLRLRALLPRLAAGALLVGVLQTVALDGSLTAARLINWKESGASAIPMATTFFSALLVGMWLSIYFAAQAVRRRRAAELNALRAQVVLRESRLRSLERQLNPHFLFNCLNSVRGMIAENPARAQEMVTRLAELLRFSLRQDEREAIPLDEELVTVDSYLELESVRFEERLRIRREIEPEARRALFPPLLLQTLVENALKHGIAHLPDGGEVLLRIARSGESLRVQVGNSGSLRPQNGAGIGLANTRERLRLLYGDRARLALWEPRPGWVEAELEIPFQVREALCEPSS